VQKRKHIDGFHVKGFIPICSWQIAKAFETGFLIAVRLSLAPP
jgi:hypothetical protein